MQQKVSLNFKSSHFKNITLIVAILQTNHATNKHRERIQIFLEIYWMKFTHNFIESFGVGNIQTIMRGR